VKKTQKQNNTALSYGCCGACTLGLGSGFSFGI